VRRRPAEMLVRRVFFFLLALVRRVDQVESSPKFRSRGSEDQAKLCRNFEKDFLDLNGLFEDLILILT